MVSYTVANCETKTLVVSKKNNIYKLKVDYDLLSCRHTTLVITIKY